MKNSAPRFKYFDRKVFILYENLQLPDRLISRSFDVWHFLLVLTLKQLTRWTACYSL